MVNAARGLWTRYMDVDQAMYLVTRTFCEMYFTGNT